jgi:hypothetical protein
MSDESFEAKVGAISDGLVNEIRALRRSRLGGISTSANAHSDNERHLCCSFCGADRQASRKVISGPGVFICDECVLACVRNGRLPAGQVYTACDKKKPIAASLPESMNCSFCGRASDGFHEFEIRSVAQLPDLRHAICSSCIRISIDVLSEELGGEWTVWQSRWQEGPIP